MLVHFRLTVPTDLSAELQQLLLEHDSITNVTVQPGAVLKPAGDLLECDVARESAGVVVARLGELGLQERGSIVLTNPTGTPFKQARELEHRIPGHPDDAVIWDSVESTAYASAVPTLTFHVFLVIAVALAAVAVVTDSAVLVVGAMVVGPEFSAIAAACAGIVLGRPKLIGAGLRLIALSFTFAILVVTALAALADLSGILTAADVTRARPNTGFIWHPDTWSLIVSLLAGAAGSLALALERSSVMVGVFISVTTVPAAGNLALGLAVRDLDEITGSAAQLGLNIAGLLVAGTLTLWLIRTSWPWLVTASERAFNVLAPRERVREGAREGARE